MFRQIRIISILDYRYSKGIRNVKKMLEMSGKKGKVQPRDWVSEDDKFRSLTVFDDGSCLLRTQTAATVIGRLRKAYR